uniref:Bardet-Biedl syndrome 7 protein n=1 Tax=Meloidogyne incognita TaxID=6306 RepID=A0A914LYV1_MELIC
MELNLNRVDYAHVGTTTNCCLKVIHTTSVDGHLSTRRHSTIKLENNTESGGGGGEQLIIKRKGSNKRKNKLNENETDKLIIGDQNGVLLCMERKDGNTNILYKTPPGPPIRRLMMGGALGSIQDKAFIACGTEVRGYSRKGKQFLAFNSNLTESIQSLYIYGIDMLIASKNSFYHFHDCVEKSHFSCSDNILDILCLPITEGGWVGRGLTPVLACADKTIKVLDGSRIVYQVPLNEVPTVLHLFCNDGGYNKQKVLFGCKNGYIGLVDLGVDFWTMCQQFETKSFGTISTIHCYPMMGEENNTQPDVLIGKDDGLIELYSVDENNNLTFRQSYQCEESITGLQGGRVGNGIHPELIVTTYTGWVFGLTTEPVFAINAGLDEKGNEAPEMEIKVQQMRLEIEQLEIKVKDERERFNNEMTRLNQIASEVPTNGNLIGNNTSLMAFTVNDRFELRKELACYNLSVELAIPIDYVLLQSDVKVDLLDVERNSAVISVTEPENESGNALLAVYRCQADITRMEMRIRSIEGQFGTLRLYIVPRLVPLTCKVCSYPIKPLALHERIHYFDEHRPMNTLTLTGSFSIAEAHSWLALCLAEVPERCPQAETVTFNFRSTFNGGTQLQANYSKGRVSYRSDNLSTIVILRDVISRIVSMGQIKVHIACDINEESIKKCLELIWPKLEYQSRLVRQLELARGLKELEATLEDLSYLNSELKQLLANYEDLHKEVDNQQIHLDRILGIITDLYIDKFKMLGQNVKHKTKELLDILKGECDLEKIVEFFNGK